MEESNKEVVQMCIEVVGQEGIVAISKSVTNFINEEVLGNKGLSNAEAIITLMFLKVAAEQALNSALVEAAKYTGEE